MVNGLKPLTSITKSSILDFATVLDPPLVAIIFFEFGAVNNFMQKLNCKTLHDYFLLKNRG